MNLRDGHSTASARLKRAHIQAQGRAIRQQGQGGRTKLGGEHGSLLVTIYSSIHPPVHPFRTYLWSRIQALGEVCGPQPRGIKTKLWDLPLFHLKQVASLSEFPDQ